MNMLDMLRRTGGLSAIANRLGISPSQSSQVADLLVPYLVAGFRRSYRRLGPDNMLIQLESLGGEEMAQAVLLPDAIPPSAGDAALRLAFGSGENASRVEQALCGLSEVEPEQFRDAMRLLTMLLGGYFAARAERAELSITDGTAEFLGRDEGDDPLDAILPPAGG